jgi:AraC-like DNA-binding protein
MSKSQPHQQTPSFFSSQVSNAKRFYLGSHEQKRHRLVVTSGGFERCDADYSIDRETFPDFCVEFVARGRGWLRLAGRQFELDSGVIFTYGPGVPQKITADPKDPPEKYFVDFKGQDAGRLVRHCHLPPGTCLRTGSHHEITRVFDSLVSDGIRGGPYANGLCSALLEYLLIKVLASPHIEKDQSTAYATYVRCKEWIEENYLRVQNLQDIGRATDIDAAYLCRLFQRYDHQSPHEYVTRLRMNRAVELLNDPEVLIKEVAAHVGFADPFHFSRAFKKTFGVSPKSFRGLRR